MPLYLIDGYNFLFRLEGTKKKPFETKRNSFIHLLNETLASFKSPVMVIFDSSEQTLTYAQHQALEHLEVVYAPKGKTADNYIIELVETSRNPKNIVVVSSDNGLCRQCQHIGCKTIKVEEFLMSFNKKRKKEKTKPDYKQLPSEMQRLLEEFEKRLRDS